MQVNIYEAKTRLSELVEAANRGESVTIAKAGKPVAMLVPITSKRGFPFGLMKGRIEIAEDFDAPLSEELLDAFEGTRLP